MNELAMSQYSCRDSNRVACWSRYSSAIVVAFATVFGGPGDPAYAQGPDAATLDRLTQIDPWLETALRSNPSVTQGEPLTLTWSIAPDGTPVVPPRIGEPNLTSDLVATLDREYGDRETWMPLVSSVFDRWSDLSGVTYLHEAADDGRPLVTVGDAPNAFGGQVGVRGDVRIGGAAIDSESPAYGTAPGSGDIAINTQHEVWNSANGLLHRNLLARQHGLGLGLSPVTSNDSDLLMESPITDRIDGPQLDEILLLHRMYGDVHEKRRGNDRPSDATELGLAFHEVPITIGTDARTVQVSADQKDFVSIDGIGDVDHYTFEASTRGFVWITLVPHGPRYSQASNVAGPTRETLLRTAALSDLKLDVLSSGGAGALASADRTGLGGSEIISELMLPEAGSYLIRVRGAQDLPQMYSLEIRFRQESRVLGDINGDGQLTAVDIDQFAARLRQGVDDFQFDLDGDDLVRFRGFSLHDRQSIQHLFRRCQFGWRV